MAGSCAATSSPSRWTSRMSRLLAACLFDSSSRPGICEWWWPELQRLQPLDDPFLASAKYDVCHVPDNTCLAINTGESAVYLSKCLGSLVGTRSSSGSPLRQLGPCVVSL